MAPLDCIRFDDRTTDRWGEPLRPTLYVSPAMRLAGTPRPTLYVSPAMRLAGTPRPTRGLPLLQGRGGIAVDCGRRSVHIRTESSITSGWDGAALDGGKCHIRTRQHQDGGRMGLPLCRERKSRVVRATTGESSTSATRLGKAISPLKMSAMPHTIETVR